MVAVAQLTANVSLTGASTAISQLTVIGVATDGAAASLIALGEKSLAAGVGFNGLATSAGAAATSLVGADASLAGVNTSLATTTVGSKAAATGIKTVASSSDIAAASSKQFAQFMGTSLLFTGVAIAAVGIASTKMAGDYEQGMNKVQALTGSSNAQMKQYNDGLLKLAVNASVGPVKLTDALYNVLSASYKGATALNVLTLATEDARIGMTNSTVTTDALTNVLRTFSVQNKDITATNGEMLQTVTLGKAAFEQYASTIVKAASSASQFHVSMEVMNAAWATMTSSGIRAAQASTDFQQSLKVMESGIATVAKSLEKNGIAFDLTKFHTMSYGDQVTYLSAALDKANEKHVKITGVTIQAAQAISTIANHINDYNANLATLSNKQEMARKTQEAWSITQSGFNAKMDQARAAVEVLMVKLGEKLLPIFGQLVSAITPLIVQFTDWISAGDRLSEFLNSSAPNMVAFKLGMVALAGAILGAMVPALIAATISFGAMAAAAWAAIIPLLPFILIGAAIALVIAGIVLAILHWGQIVAWLKVIWSDVVVFFGGVFGAIGQWFGGIGAWFHDRFLEAKFAVIAVFGPIGAWFHDRANEITGFFGGIGAWFHDRFNDARIAITVVFGTIGQWFHDRFTEAYNAIGNVFGKIGQYFTDRWNEVYLPLKPLINFIGAVFQTIWNIIVAVAGKIGHLFVEQWNQIVQVFSLVAEVLQTDFMAGWNAIVKIFNILGFFFAQQWNQVVQVFSAVGDILHTKFTEGWNAIVLIFKVLGFFFQQQWNSVVQVLSVVGDFMHNQFLKGWNGITVIFNVLGQYFTDRWNEVVRVFGAVGGWFHDRFVEAWNNIVIAFTPLAHWFQGQWDNLVKGVGVMHDNFVAKFNDIKTGVINIIHDMINGVVDKLNDGISAVEGFINFFGSGLNALATDVGAKGTIPTAHLPRVPHYEAGTDAMGHPGGPMVVGEKGRELLMAPRGTTVLAHAQTEQLLGGNIPGYAGGIGDLLGGIGNWIKDKTGDLIKGMVDSLPQLSLPGGLSSMAGGIISTIEGWAIDWLKNLLPANKAAPTGASGGSGGNLKVSGDLAQWLQSAMALTGAGLSWLSPLETIAMSESGGNPNAVNNTDINAQEGHPSQGLMQTIPSTFAAYMVAGHGDILNPVDNAAAAINYIKARYGSVFNVPGIASIAAGGNYVGYADGVDSAPGGYSWVGERGKELMYVPRGAQITPNSQSSSAGPQIVVQTPPVYLDGRLLMGGLMPHFVDGVRYQSGSRTY